MADVARTAIVSKENHNGLLVDESIKNNASGDSNDLTECSASNHTNNCSNRSFCSSAIEPKEGYQEIDSFSELSFKTTDEISLQDLIESEFAARISTINGDEFSAKTIDDCWSTPGSVTNKSHDPFDELFEGSDGRDSENLNGDPMRSIREKDLPPSAEEEEEERGPKNELVTSNLDDFISGPMKGDTSLITDFSGDDDDVVVAGNAIGGGYREGTKSVNIFKLDIPNEIPILTNFDPFTAIEEDSDCSNPIGNSNFPNSPDEFPFPESPQETKDWGKADGCSVKDYIEKTGNDSQNIIVNKSKENVMRELFTKRISDENLDGFPEQNCDENGGFSKFHVMNNTSSVESVNNSYPNASNLTSPEKNDIDEFYSSEDIVKGSGELSKKEEKPDEEEETQNVETEVRKHEDVEVKEISPPAKVDLFIDDEPFDEFEDFSNEEESHEATDSQQIIRTKEFEEDWTTVEEALKAQPENFELDGDSCSVDVVTNECDFVVGSSTNDVSGPTPSQVNGLSESESESETKSESNSFEKKTVKKKKSKKGKKSDEKENISVEPKSGGKTSGSSTIEDIGDLSNVSVKNLKSSFSKFDQLSKKTILHVRSVDTTKVQKQFNEASTGAAEVTCNCKSCGKQVFQMEQIKAEKSVWHKNCFRCKECNKQLSVDTYSSHEGVLYCKPHFRELFKPKAVLEDETEPASDKPDLGLEELASLNVKSRFQVFEKGEENKETVLEKSPSSVNVKRSPSILSKLAKFQKKGIDVGVCDDELNGLPIEQSSESSEEEEEENDESASSKKIIKSKKIRERPMSFSKMGDVKSVWESGVPKTREEMREERKQEIHQIRSKLFMGKQVKMKEAYEQAVRESESMSPRKSIDIRCEKAKSIKECFEKGEPLNVDEENEGEEKKKIVEDDMSVFEAGISKKSRSLFLELDKSAKSQVSSGVKKPSPKSPSTPTRSREPILSNPFNTLVTSNCKTLMKIFMYPHEKAENKFGKKCAYKGIALWKERRHCLKAKIGFFCEVSRQPSDSVVKSSDAVEEVQIETADISSKFKFFETYKEPEREKKKFRITPPREGQVKTESPEKEIYRDPNVVRASDKVEQEIIRTNTTAKMLSLFRQMEEKTEEIPEGPKPLKRFTPPPDYKEDTEGESEESEESEEEENEDESNPNIIRASDKIEDEYLKQAASAARAKQLRAKFEKWEEKEKEKEREESAQIKLNGSTNNTITENSENVEVTSIECTKSLRARFESMKAEAENPKEKVMRPKVNRFVEIQNNMAQLCDVCSRRVYQLEKVETSGKIFHKTCFRCMQCNCLLRMESFTLNCGNLYCLPHFKQKFISKGNYDEGFGVDQHKAKWPTVTSF